MSYFYHVIGLKDYSDALRKADEAENTLLNQHDVLVNALMILMTWFPQQYTVGSIDNIMEAFDGVRIWVIQLWKQLTLSGQ